MSSPVKKVLLWIGSLGHDIGKCNKVGACIVCASMVVESGHQTELIGSPSLQRLTYLATKGKG